MDKRTKTKLTYLQRARAGAAVCDHLVIELRETARLALPLTLAQLGQIAMTTTDLVLIGHFSSEAVAAAGLAVKVYSVCVTFGMGLLAAVATIAAEAFGAGKLASVRRSVRMGLWATLLLSLPIMLLPLLSEQMLVALGQAPDAARLAQQYLVGLTWGLAPALWFLAIRSFMGAVHRPQPILWIMLAAVPCNALLVYLLIHGKLGLPKLELFGAGLATTLVNFATFLAGLWFVTTRRPFSDYHVLAHLWRPDWTQMRRLIVIGIPVSIAFLMEGTIWSAAALLIGMISTRALAAHQIAAQVGAILFMIPTGISMAANVRVGYALGRNDGPGVKKAGLVAILLGTVTSAILAILIIVARFEIAEFFLGNQAGALIDLTTDLILVGASCFVTTAVYSIALASLRGLKDTRIPLLFAAVGYWLVGFSLSCLLGLKIGFGAIGVWVGLSIGTTLYAALLVLRFLLLASRLGLQGR
ncbi:MATE family efflux transporter [Bradyrhizobium cajani]|uniref:Multidrug-efflux transporter n=1 Tax=Bradyrhizobium cajani TaxID=1928661 RepID=A0A844T398_9BRAD|nr:MATE family efflux transporter [Bradyrhizobium cajani]MCP3368606.1 MATE family efflux transporter [Bradyrhizobium cajani]MVT73598.1 MATE family efflux transporter [Bradyrhizobium cajani]